VRRLAAALILAALALLGTAATATANPAFGPGNGEQVGERCHPPGQSTEVPGCK
jgi:Spy/CpxP family protein refolding chaperone